MNKQSQANKIHTRTTIDYYKAGTIAATITLLISLQTLCLLLGIKFRFNTEYNYDFRALVVSVGLSIISFTAMLYYKERKLSLFLAITFWVTLGLFSYTLLSAVWGAGKWPDRLFAGWHPTGGGRLDQVKTTLTAIGGIGGVGYLVIKYRERSASERGEADEKLLHAVQQLGNTSAQVRIAGVYALADVADTYEGPYHQRVVDILCDYLRTDRLLKDANGETRYATDKDGVLNYDHPLSSDGPVESAILSIIASHLQQTPITENDTANGTAMPPWSFYRIDLHDATLTEQVYFTDCQFWQIDLRRTTFFDRAVFSRSHFTGATSFEYATFKKTAKYNQALFDFHSSFQGTIFEKEVFFDQTEFRTTANFKEARFANTVDFSSTHFASEPEFDDTTSNQET